MVALIIGGSHNVILAEPLPSDRFSRVQINVTQPIPIPRPQDLLGFAHRETDAAESRPLGRVRALAQGRPLGRELAHRDDDGRRDRVRRDLAEQVRRQAQDFAARGVVPGPNRAMI